MTNIILIAVSLIAGIISGRIKSVPKDSYKLLNFIIINFCLPAMAILYLPEIKINTELMYPLASMWIVFIAGAAIFAAAGKMYHLGKGTTRCSDTHRSAVQFFIHRISRAVRALRRRRAENRSGD
jgi:hypothetical protein